MARIKGVDIPDNKRIEISLTYVYGIGKSLSNRILKDAKVNPDKRAGELTIDELNAIRDEVNKYMTEGDLRREVNMNIKTKMEKAFSVPLWTIRTTGKKSCAFSDTGSRPCRF